MSLQNGEGGGKCSISTTYSYLIASIKMGELAVHEDWYPPCDRDQISHESKKTKAKQSKTNK